MIDLTKGIESLTSFKRDTSRFLAQLQETGQPLVLTINGKAALIVQDVASYQRLVEDADRREAIAGVKEGLEDVAAGRTQPMREALRDLGRKHKLDQGD